MKLNLLIRVANLLPFVLILANCSTAHVSGSSNKELSLKATSSSKINGDISLAQQGRDVLFKIHATGLKPNSIHAIHIHELGDCTSADASSAGGHFDPNHNLHGAPSAKNHHAGDLGNFIADNNGYVDTVITGRNLSLDRASKLSIIDRAIIIHEKHDDMVSQPSGAAGKRIACTVIM